jgi:hypothetical protein
MYLEGVSQLLCLVLGVFQVIAHQNEEFVELDEAILCNANTASKQRH